MYVAQNAKRNECSLKIDEHVIRAYIPVPPLRKFYVRWWITKRPKRKELGTFRDGTKFCASCNTSIVLA